ncbi:hypothetical protein [Azospirillum rugosum]|uniref:Uncharacterized protein n=1 Tax=Azospirillum rugosum TaxID=416170 RepID=A0ABS4SSG5_9PROT|nr:hypothetical protein [Azospirillum rugosum]MBP2295500.1 hypothetical protein [Azospirillum rugosum]MDQ0528379.1 hypothetical protein [Azospirillum rugosum]
MTTTTFSHGTAPASSNAGHSIREFLTDWFKATPVYIVYSLFAR